MATTNITKKRSNNFTYNRLKHLYHKAKGDPIGYDLAPYLTKLRSINEVGNVLCSYNDNKLRKKVADIARLVENSGLSDDIVYDAVALVREVSHRLLGLRHFDVQIIAGLVLHDGKIAELQTGEGKTLAAVIPAYLHSLTGEQVHIVTANDYLSKRDAQWMGPIYNFLGLDVGSIGKDTSRLERKNAYGRDVLYPHGAGSRF